MKFELTNNKRVVHGIELRQIKALKDFKTSVGEVKAGDLGGWLEYGCNLDQTSTAWVTADAKVYGANSLVETDSVVTDNATVTNTTVRNGSIVRDGARVNRAIISSSTIGGHAIIDGHIIVIRDSMIAGASKIVGTAYISGGDISAPEFIAKIAIDDETFCVYNGKDNTVWCAVINTISGAKYAPEPCEKFIRNLAQKFVPYREVFVAMANTIGNAVGNKVKRFYVPVVWSMNGYVDVNLSLIDNPTMTDAIKYVNDHISEFSPPTGSYIKNSFSVDEGGLLSAENAIIFEDVRRYLRHENDFVNAGKIVFSDDEIASIAAQAKSANRADIRLAIAEIAHTLLEEKRSAAAHASNSSDGETVTTTNNK